MKVKDKRWLLTFEVMDDGINDKGDKGNYLPQSTIVESIINSNIPSGVSVKYVGGFEVTE